MREAMLSDDGLRLAELNHRIRNMLQIVASLLNAQARRTSGDRGADALLAAEAQIRAFALLGDALAHAGASGTVCVANYLRSLATHLDAACLAPRAIALHTDTPDTLLLGERSAQALGLSVVECVMNAVKHAFGETPEPCIALRLEPRGPQGGAHCTVADNGRGAAADAPLGKGLVFVRTLAARAGGGCVAESGPEGVRVTITVA